MKDTNICSLASVTTNIVRMLSHFPQLSSCQFNISSLLTSLIRCAEQDYGTSTPNFFVFIDLPVNFRGEKSFLRYLGGRRLGGT